MLGRRLLAGVFLLAVFLLLGALLAITWPSHAVEGSSTLSVDACGPIGSDTTWALADSPHLVTCDVTVNAGVTLTIEPGVVVSVGDTPLYAHIYAVWSIVGHSFLSSVRVP